MVDSITGKSESDPMRIATNFIDKSPQENLEKVTQTLQGFKEECNEDQY